MEELASDDQLDERLAQPGLLVVYFSTPSCGVCRSLRPRVAAALEQRRLKGVYVDTGRLPRSAGQRLVFAVPTVLIYVEGRELRRFGRHFAFADFERALERACELR